MPELNDILAAFELTLNLERELGTNVLEFDRSILVAPKIDAQKQNMTAAKPADRHIVSPPVKETLAVKKETPPIVKEQIKEVAPASAASPVIEAEPINVAEINEGGNSASPDFLFAVEVSSNQEAEVLFRRMIAAMGYPDLESVYTLRLPPISRGNTVSNEVVKRVSETVSRVSPKAIVLFGSSVTSYFYPGKILRKGILSYANIPLLVTNSPVRILRSNTPTNAVKRETWLALQLILSKIGKTPPEKKS
jgi:hypothetical protein